MICQFHPEIPMKIMMLRCTLAALFLLAFTTCFFGQLTGNDRDITLGMLEQTRDAIKKNYYDPNFKGIDLDAVFRQAEQRLRNASSRDEAIMLIAQAANTF